MGGAHRGCAVAPGSQGAVGAAAEHAGAGEGEGGDAAAMAEEGAVELAVARPPHHHGAVAAGGGEEVAVATGGHGVERQGVAAELHGAIGRRRPPRRHRTIERQGQRGATGDHQVEHRLTDAPCGQAGAVDGVEAQPAAAIADDDAGIVEPDHGHRARRRVGHGASVGRPRIDAHLGRQRWSREHAHHAVTSRGGQPPTVGAPAHPHGVAAEAPGGGELEVPHLGAGGRGDRHPPVVGRDGDAGHGAAAAVELVHDGAVAIADDHAAIAAATAGGRQLPRRRPRHHVDRGGEGRSRPIVAQRGGGDGDGARQRRLVGAGTQRGVEPGQGLARPVIERGGAALFDQRVDQAGARLFGAGDGAGPGGGGDAALRPRLAVGADQDRDHRRGNHGAGDQRRAHDASPSLRLAEAGAAERLLAPGEAHRMAPPPHPQLVEGVAAPQQIAAVAAGLPLLGRGAHGVAQLGGEGVVAAPAGEARPRLQQRLVHQLDVGAVAAVAAGQQPGVDQAIDHGGGRRPAAEHLDQLVAGQGEAGALGGGEVGQQRPHQRAGVVGQGVDGGIGVAGQRAHHPADGVVIAAAELAQAAVTPGPQHARGERQERQRRGGAGDRGHHQPWQGVVVEAVADPRRRLGDDAHQLVLGGRPQQHHAGGQLGTEAGGGRHPHQEVVAHGGQHPHLAVERQRHHRGPEPPRRRRRRPRHHLLELIDHDQRLCGSRTLDAGDGGGQVGHRVLTGPAHHHRGGAAGRHHAGERERALAHARRPHHHHQRAIAQPVGARLDLALAAHEPRRIRGGEQRQPDTARARRSRRARRTRWPAPAGRRRPAAGTRPPPRRSCRHRRRRPARTAPPARPPPACRPSPAR